MKKNSIYIWFIVPSIILIGFAIIYPFISGVKIAFTDWDGISKSYNYIGFDNFIRMFRDQNLKKSIGFTLAYGVVGTLLFNLVSLGLAVLLSQEFKGVNFCKTVFFIPMALSPVLAAFIFQFIDSKLYAGHLAETSLLGRPETVLIGIVIVAIWNGVGSDIMVYLAGLTNISTDYYEAAEIDGASGWQRFKFITLPLLGPSFTICITLNLTSCLREFATVMAATDGGPANSSQTVAIFLYRNLFTYQKAGYGQAIAISFMVILLVIGISLKNFFRSREVEM